MVRTKHQQRNQEQRRKCSPNKNYSSGVVWASVVFELDHARMFHAKSLGTITPALYKRARESKGTFVRSSPS